MSIKQVDLVLRYSQATSAAKLILVGIANHANDAGEAWPSRELLAGYANCSVRSVTRHLSELVDLGELIIDKNGGPQLSRHRPNHYQIQSNRWTDSVQQVDKMGPIGGQLWPTNRHEPSLTLSAKKNSVIDDLEAARLDRERRLAEGRKLSEWMAEQAAKAEPMPHCHHGRKLLNCLECCQALNESEKTA